MIAPLVARFEARIPDAAEFARANRVLLLRADGGIPLDIALGALDFERRAVERSSPWQVPGVTPLRTCSAEDLVVHKVFAGRDRDWADVAGVVDRYGSALDAVLIRAELGPLLELKDDRAGMLRLDALLDFP